MKADLQKSFLKDLSKLSFSDRDEELKKEAFKVAFKQDAYLKRWRKLLGTTFNKHTL